MFHHCFIGRVNDGDNKCEIGCLFESEGFLYHGLLLLLPLAEPHHRHLELHHEQLHLVLLDKLAQGLQNPVLRELLSTEH